MTKTLIKLLAALALFALPAAAQTTPPAPPAGDDDGMGGDLGGTAQAEVVDWFPVIRSLYVEPLVKGKHTEMSKIPFKPHETQALPSEQLIWEDFRKLVERRGAKPGEFAPYGPEDKIVSGWRYVVDKEKGTTGYEIEMSKPGQPIQVMLRDVPCRVFFDFDVIMTTDPDRKKEYLQKYFHFVSQELSARKVPSKIDMSTDDPNAPQAMEAYRAPSDETDQLRWAGYERGNDPIGLTVLNADGNYSIIDGTEFNSPGPQVWEVRARIAVSGKLPGQAEVTTKDVQGVIRFAFLNTPIKIDVLSRDRQGRKSFEGKTYVEKPGR